MGSRQDLPTLRGRLRQARRLALAIAALILAGAGGGLVLEFEKAKQQSLRDLGTMARVLSNETAVQLDGVRAVLAAVGENYAMAAGFADRTDPSRLLADSAATLRTVRSLSHVDSRGVVVASSVPSNVGTQLPLAQLGIQFGESAALGSYLPWRDLSDAGRPAAGRTPGLLVMGLALPDGHGYLVAALNTDRFATMYELLGENLADRAALLTFRGMLVVAGRKVSAEPGLTRRDIPPFTRFLPVREAGEYAAPGLDGDAQLGAFRTVRGWPLLVVVQLPAGTLWASWLPAALTVAALAGTLLAGLLVVAGLVFRDVRRQAAAHADVEASEARQQAILESALDAIVSIDGSGKIRQFNAAAEAMFGYSRAVAEGQLMHELLVPPDARAAHQAGMARVLGGGPSNILRRRVEVLAMRQDGTIFPIEIAIVPVETAGVMWFTSTIRDITQRSAAEQALRQSEARFRATFEQAVVGMMHQAEDRRILRVNSRLCEMLGYTEIEFLTMQTQDFIHPDDIARGRQAMAELFAGTRNNWVEEKRYRHKRGHYLWVRLTASVVQPDTANRYMSCVIEDISDYKRAVTELDAARARELEIGARIQQSLLVDPTPAHIEGLDFAAYSQPSRGIDGDFYDVVDLGHGMVDIVVGDVMGKGVPAALLGAAAKMQFARSMSRLMAQGLPEPAEVLASVDRAIGPHLHALNAFVTLVYLRFDPRSETLTWVGCGHEEPLLVRADGSIETLHNQKPPVGVFTGQGYEQSTCAFGPGARLFMCSDGASDALLPDGTRVGRDRIHTMVRKAFSVHKTSGMSLHAVRRELLLAEVRLTDDLTMLVVSRGTSSRARMVDLPVMLSSVEPARKFVEAECERVGMSPEQAGPFTVAVVEAITNVVRHARGLTPGAPLELSSHRVGDNLVIEVRYFGDYFEPPRDVPDTDLSTLPEGGFGLSIMKKASERQEHSYKDGVNTLRLVARRG